METSILEVNEDGLEVSLIDGSNWQINPGDISKTICWYATQRIKIEENVNEAYSHTLINLDTAAPDKAKASRIF